VKIRKIPQPEMFSDWKEWASQFLIAHEVDSGKIEVKGDYADDTAAATAGVAVGEYYRTGSVVKVRVS
jgi:hypothetical protein